jgi:hypothetical protein
MAAESAVRKIARIEEVSNVYKEIGCRINDRLNVLLPGFLTPLGWGESWNESQVGHLSIRKLCTTVLLASIHDSAGRHQHVTSHVDSAAVRWR